MYLNSFKYAKEDNLSYDMYCLIWQEIEKLEGYIKFCLNSNNKEAINEQKQMMFFHAITHYDGKNETLVGYLKKLAQTIHRQVITDVPVEFSDGVITYGVGNGGSVGEPNVLTRPMTECKEEEQIENFVNSYGIEQEVYKDVCDLAINNISEFVFLCKALLKSDITSSNYSVAFSKACLKLSYDYKDVFNLVCLEVYKQYERILDRFAYEELRATSVSNLEKVWQETDYIEIKKKQSKRVVFYNKNTKEPIKDVDTESFYVGGKRSITENKRILKIDYFNAWILMCDLVDSKESNTLKLVLGDKYVVKTLGGSVSLLNPPLYNIYELIRNEILTNVLYETYGRVISVGTKSMYILWDNSLKTLFQQNMKKLKKGKNKWVVHKHLYDIEFDLIYEDVTDSLDIEF